MDKQTAKEILAAYRQNGADAENENFRDALQLCQRDPEMSKWFESQTAFDSSFSDALDSIRPPAASKSALLATVRFENESEPIKLKPRFQWWRLTMAAAALFALSFVTFQLFDTESRLTSAYVAEAYLFGIVSELANHAFPLEKTGRDLSVLQDWLVAQGAPSPRSVPASLTQHAIPAGCRTFELEGGLKVSLVCYLHDNQLVHVFVMDRDSLPGLEFDERSWQQRDGWQMYAWSEGNSLMTIASQIPMDSLSALIEEV